MNSHQHQGIRHPGALRALGLAGLLLILLGGFAAALVWNPALGVIAAVVVASIVLARCFQARAERIFLYSLVILLAGYALLSRTFAGIGVPPVFVGEVVLALGLLSAIANGWQPSLVGSRLIYVLVAFMAWGLAQTIPYLDVYGINALRDAVIWGYATFTLLVVPLVVSRDLVWRIPRLFSRLIPWIVVVGPAWVIIGVATNFVVIPGTVMTAAKSGDAAVHLAGAAAFLLAGVVTRTGPAGRRSLGFGEWAVWVAIIAGVVALGSLNRGGFLAVVASIMTVTALRPLKAGRKLILVGATAILVASVWLGGQSAYVQRDTDRAITPEQIGKNLMSIVGGGASNLDNTRQWRLMWWNAIIDYTVHGEYFWTGKGFGINLTYVDGIERDPDHPSRSPHNGHLTVLARAGVPGLVLWTVIQVWFGLSMLVGCLRARRAGQQDRASLFAWVLAYWLAFLVNASFDTYLEGPQGGIWFWCLLGYGIALTIAQGQRPAHSSRVAVASPWDRHPTAPAPAHA